MEWRKVNDIDNVQTWKAPENLFKDYPLVVTGLDNEGCPGETEILN